MKVDISKRAKADAKRIEARWRKHADDPSIFRREFLEAIKFLRTTTYLGSPFPTEKRPHLKRILLEKSRCHIYFEIDDKKQMIKVLALWGGQRERPPNL